MSEIGLCEIVEGKNVFLSGPMTGLAHYNVAKFATAHALLKEAGARHVYDPAYMWLNEQLEVSEGKAHEDYMQECLYTLTRPGFGGGPYYDVLAQIPGWDGSEGARCEYDVAKKCGLTIVEMDCHLERDYLERGGEDS